MKIAVALQGVSRLFLDTAPVVYHVESNAAYKPLVDSIFNQIDAGTIHAVTSPITLAECLVMPIRLGLTQAQQDFTDLIVAGPNVTFVNLNESMARQAAELRARYNLGLADSFQVASALAAGCDALLTNDLGLKRVTELPILVLDELEL